MNVGQKSTYFMAKEQRLWICEVKTNLWFTPDEFEKASEAGQLAFGSEYEIRDPFQAIIQARQKINGLTYRTNQFESRVFKWAKDTLKIT